MRKINVEMKGCGHAQLYTRLLSLACCVSFFVIIRPVFGGDPCSRVLVGVFLSFSGAQLNDIESALTSRSQAEKELESVAKLAAAISRQKAADDAKAARVNRNTAKLPVASKTAAAAAAAKPPGNAKAPEPLSELDTRKPKSLLFDPSFFDSLFKGPEKKPDQKEK